MATKEWKAKNPEKLREYRRVWYAKNSQASIDASIKRRRELHTWLKEYKESFACAVCGESDPACIDFHHNNPGEKEVEVSRIVFIKGWGKERIIKEIAKCTPMCANCHRKLHRKLLDASVLIVE